MSVKYADKHSKAKETNQLTVQALEITRHAVIRQQNFRVTTAISPMTCVFIARAPFILSTGFSSFAFLNKLITSGRTAFVTLFSFFMFIIYESFTAL